MKKLILLLLFTAIGYGQVSTGNEPYSDYGFRSDPAALQIPATVNYLGTYGTDGTSGRITPLNVTVPYVPLNYTILTPTLGGHLAGIDTKINTLSSTTAGISIRLWFTADQTTIVAGTFNLTNALSKGATASDTPTQSVTNGDDQKQYIGRDLIGIPFATATIFPVGVYAGNLSASTSPNSAQQRWTVELYKCDNNGTPIASGITGAPVGDLGVTVITILDSGLLTLVDGSVTNVPVSGNLASPLSVAVGERIRYHVSAEKVGTAGTNITQSVYYGTSYNSYLDVPVPLNTNGIKNGSLVIGDTATDALNTLNNDKISKTGTGTLMLTDNGSTKLISHDKLILLSESIIGTNPQDNKAIEKNIDISTRRNLFANSETYTAGNSVIVGTGMTIDNADTFVYKGITMSKFKGTGYVGSTTMRQTVLTPGSRYLVSYYVKSNNTNVPFIWDNLGSTIESGHGARFVDNTVRRVSYLYQAVSNYQVASNLVPTTPIGSGSTSFIFFGVTKSNTYFSDLYIGGIQIEEVSSSYVDGVVWMGDSTIATDSGPNNSPSSTAIPRWFEGVMNCSSYNVAIGGQRLDQMDARWATDVTPLKPNSKYVVIQGGINDISQGRTLVDMQTSVNSMVSKALADGFIPVLLTCTPDSSNTAGQEIIRNDFNTWLIATFKNVIDINVIVEGTDSKILNGMPLNSFELDGIHYGLQLRKSVGEYIAKSGFFVFLQPSDYQFTSATYTGKTVKALSFVKDGGLSTEYLMANGTVSTLLNPITGTGASGQVSFWSGTNTQAGDNAMFWNDTNKTLSLGTTLAVGSSRFTVLGSDNVIGIRGSASGSTATPLSRKIAWFTASQIEHASINVPDALTNTVAVPMIFSTRSTAGSYTEKMRIHPAGGISIGNTTDLGAATLNVTGNISTIAGSTANHVIIKSQHDLKADLASPTFTGDPKAPTPTASDNDTSIATTAFVTGEIATAIVTARPYKVYTALLTQTGTSAPTAIVLENTTGGTISYSYTAVGRYQLSISGVSFPTNKCTVITEVNSGYLQGGYGLRTSNFGGSTLDIYSYSNLNASTLSDVILNLSTIEIKIYP